jgi:hypothetical protein
MEQFKEEIIAGVSKIWVWLLYILMGLIAKYSYDIMRGKKITLLQAMASAGIALFVGFISSALCVQHDMEKEGMWIVPISTLLSEKLLMALFAIDWKRVTV